MGKRLIALISVFTFLFTSLTIRCGYIAISKAYKVSDTYNSYSLDVGRLYPYIYDRIGNRLNNNTTTPVAIIRPNEKCLAELDRLFSPDEIDDIAAELSKGYPVIKDINNTVDTKYIKIVERINENTPDMPCRHLLDYQCGGLEAITNKEIGRLYVNFPTDATGRLLNGDNVDIINNNYDTIDGITISIDKRIQEICESSSASISKGAVVVMDTSTSQLLASVSIGNDYNNRALSSYAIGSVFKIVVCACALESGVKNLYNCNGSITVGDTTFSCQKNKAHGLQSMKSALANSCNCYFVSLALKLGSQRLCDTARSLGFGEEFTLYDEWNITSGNMPDVDTLSSSGQLALLGFGQGRLTDSPVHFASVLSCIANGGYYNPPTLKIKESDYNRVLSESTCSTVLDYMQYVVKNGTGAGADFRSITAGKTATAQSGVYADGREILNTYFAGVYPVYNPKYAIVVMCEDGVSGAEDCCPVFRTIVEKLENL